MYREEASENDILWGAAQLGFYAPARHIAQA